MKQTVKRKIKRKEPHKTRPFYLHNEDHPKMDPPPAHSQWIATAVILVLVIALTWFLCSCSGFGEMPYGLGAQYGQIKRINVPHEAVHVPSAEDGP